MADVTLVSVAHKTGAFGGDRSWCKHVITLVVPRHFLATSSSSRRDVHAANLSRVLKTYTFGCRRRFFILKLAFFKYVPPREYRILGGEFFEALGGVFGGFVAPYKTLPTKVRRPLKIVAHT